MVEHMMLSIAILGGTGKEGTGLALRWAKNGYKIMIGSRSLEKAQAAAAQLNVTLGMEAVEGLENSEAARRADLCVLTVVQEAHQDALEGLKEVLQGKILVDATARVAFKNPVPPTPPSAGRIAQVLLGPGVRVVAALQNVPASSLKNNLDQELDFDVLVCADDLDAAEEVMQLIRGGDMRAWYAGGLDNAIVVEGLTSVLISLNKHYKSKHATIKITGIEDESVHTG